MLISDGGGQAADDADPPADWPRQILRVLKVIDNQVRELRKRQAIGSYRAGLRAGTYWGIRSAVADYGLADPLEFDAGEARELAATPTRLRALAPVLQERLVDWGYVICDTALRRWLPALGGDAAGEAALQLTGRALAQANASRGRRRLRRVRAGWPSARARRHSTIVSPVGMSHSTYRMV